MPRHPLQNATCTVHLDGDGFVYQEGDDDPEYLFIDGIAGFADRRPPQDEPRLAVIVFFVAIASAALIACAVAWISRRFQF